MWHTTNFFHDLRFIQIDFAKKNEKILRKIIEGEWMRWNDWLKSITIIIEFKHRISIILSSCLSRFTHHNIFRVSMCRMDGDLHRKGWKKIILRGKSGDELMEQYWKWELRSLRWNLVGFFWIFWNFIKIGLKI